MYLHLEIDTRSGMPVGGWISDPLKSRDTQVGWLVEALGEALDAALKSHAREWTGSNEE